jgi:hypothetical protein
MATTPEGTPYVESSDLVANYPAASLALANRVDLVGVLPFATSAARATAIPSPTDGQYSYLQDTNLTQFWNGSAWQTAGLTPGLTMVTPTSIANSGGSASASGGEVTFTGVTSVSLNGVFTSTYQNYQIVIEGFCATAATNLQLRYRTSGTDNSTSNYNVQRFVVTGSSGTAVQNSSQNIAVAGTWGLGASLNVFTVANPQLAKITIGRSVTASNDSTTLIQDVAFIFNASTVFDGISLIGINAITGTIRVYGYQNS